MPRDFPRSRRIEDQIQRILSDVLRTEVRDPRLASVIITAVKISRDLSVARVFYTELNIDDDAQPLDAAFVSAMGFLRSRLASQLTVRRVPELRFELDEVGVRARDMDQLLDSLHKADPDKQDPDQEA
jgi:ribosome-binding factor A